MKRCQSRGSCLLPMRMCVKTDGVQMDRNLWNSFQLYLHHQGCPKESIPIQDSIYPPLQAFGQGKLMNKVNRFDFKLRLLNQPTLAFLFVAAAWKSGASDDAAPAGTRLLQAQRETTLCFGYLDLRTNLQSL